MRVLFDRYTEDPEAEIFRLVPESTEQPAPEDLTYQTAARFMSGVVERAEEAPQLKVIS